MDPFIRTERYYRRRSSAIYSALAFVFCLGGIVAFTFNHVTLIGYRRIAEFSGLHAHIAGVACFLITAFWVYKALQQYRVTLPTLLSPYVVALVVSGALLAIKHG